MNDPIERDSEEVGVAVAHTDQQVVTETITPTPNLDDVHGRVEMHTDHHVTMESEAMSSDVVAAQVVDTVQETPVENSIYNDPIFGPIKRLLIDIIGEE